MWCVYVFFFFFLGLLTVSRLQKLHSLLTRVNNRSLVQAEIRSFFQQESAYLRRKRRPLRLNDFEIHAILGRGGFGKVLVNLLF